jgi:uncharacterized protein YjbI with pentapeptide repeats
VLTQFRFAIIAAAALGAVWAGQASAFWPFTGVTRLNLEPAYGGVCEECDLSGRILAGARLSNSVFNRADFSDAVLTRADASRSEFEAADFSGADLRNVNFNEADVTRANFEEANIAGANLETAHGLTQRQLNSACGDVQTRVRRGLRVRMCD